VVKRYFLDTNAVIALLGGNTAVADLLKEADWIGMSVIAEIEFLAYEKITPVEIETFRLFANRVMTADLTSDDFSLISECIRLRRETGLKLPDAVIAAQTNINGAVLVTADRYFDKVPGLKVLNYLKNKE
jgi:predicted nucleic acid-binding protein